MSPHPPFPYLKLILITYIIHLSLSFCLSVPFLFLCFNLFLSFYLCFFSLTYQPLPLSLSFSLSPSISVVSFFFFLRLSQGLLLPMFLSISFLFSSHLSLSLPFQIISIRVRDAGKVGGHKLEKKRYLKLQ